MKYLVLGFVFYALINQTYAQISSDHSAVLNTIKQLNTVGISVDEEAYIREFEYNRQNLSLEDRAVNEASLLQETIAKTVTESYEKAFKLYQNQQKAKDEVMALMEKDLELVDESLKPTLRNLVIQHLNGSMNNYQNEVVSEEMIEVLKETSKMRNELIQFSEKETKLIGLAPAPGGGDKDRDDNAANNVTTDNRGPLSPMSYSSKLEVAQELVKEKRNERWVSTANTSISVGELSSKKIKFGVKVSVKFMGAKAEFGPTLMFWKTYNTNVRLLTEGLSPFMDQNGVFDYYLRDKLGKPIKEDGEFVRRFLVFTCEANLDFGSEYGGEGEFEVPIVGGDIGPVAAGVNFETKVELAKSFQRSISMESRRLYVPESIDNKQVTAATLADVCFNYFLKAKAENNISVENNMDNMAKNLISSLTFSSPKTRCVKHDQCNSWYNNKVLAIYKHKTAPRCVEQNRQEAMYGCELRGTRGANCTVVKDGKRVSSGSFEYTCDQGLKCKVVHVGGWFQNWEIWDSYRGQCL